MARTTRSFEAIVPDLAKGLRAAAATLVPFFLAAKLGRAELVWMALGGWLGTLVDPGGTRAARARIIAAFAAVGAIAVPAAELCAGSTALATAALAIAAFGGSIARARGAGPASVGTMTAILVAIGTTRAEPHVAMDALSFVGGAAWATLLSSVVWPIWTHLPVRQAVARVYDELAAYARAIDACAKDAVPAGDPRWAELARTHHARIRAAIEAARAIAVAVRARRIGETTRGSNLRLLLGASELQFPVLVSILVELEPIATRPSLPLEAIAARYDRVAHALLAHRSTPPIDDASPASSVGSSHLSALALQLESASRRSSAIATSLDALAPAEPPHAASAAPARAPLLRDLRDALSPRSTFFRHALRVTCACVVASIVGRAISAHPHWVTVTTLAVLQPYPGATVTRAAERVVGTVLGSAAAATITMLVRSPLALASTMVPLSVAAVATRPRSYRLFTFFLTPVFVLLAERYPGDWWTAAARSGDALAGGALAFVAAVVVFPSSEKKRLPDALGDAIAAVADYARAVLASFDDRDAPAVAARVAAARREAGLALGAAETSLERFLAEPLRRPEDAVDAMQVVTYARRAGSAVTAIDTHVAAGRARGNPAPDAIASYVSTALVAAERAVRDGVRTPASDPPPTERAPAPLRAAIDRLVAHASLLAALASK